MTTGKQPRDFRPLFPLDNPEQWVNQAIRLYGLLYDFMGSYSAVEYDHLLTRLEELRACIPEQYKAGVHVIGPGAAHLGEDIIVVDGRLTHNIHLDCPRCHGPRLVWRAQALSADEGTRPWCVACNQFVLPWALRTEPKA